MELRVWVDGTQRVVCGVKLTTTCQEIVFALAHATQQAGRFTMIERWRNNERLLSPNEQPLVTLQRWGDHMNEVEFILRKTSTDVPTHSHSQSQLQQQQQQPPQQQQLQQQQPLQQQQQRTNQPPAVPAKPRVLGPMAPMTNLNMPTHQQLQPVNNAQMNYYHHRHQNHSPLSLYQNNLRPRHPPGYLDYIEAMASRNSLPHPPILTTNSAYNQQSQHAQGNMYQRSYEPQQPQQPISTPLNQQQQQLYHMQRNGASSVSLGSMNNLYRYSSNGQLPNGSFDRGSQDLPIVANGMRSANPTRSKLIDSGLVFNRGSAVNVKLHPSGQNNTNSQTSAATPTTTISSTTNDRPTPESSSQNTSASDVGPSVSQMGHDMLKVIEEQKKVLIQSKNELNKLDNDQEYWELRQNSEQTELINRIEKEIRQLEELWKENQEQIQKLENQDFEKELQELKSDQVKMELELEKQKNKLSRCENDIVLCKSKIEELQTEMANLVSDSEDNSSTSSNSGTQAENAYPDAVNESNMLNDMVKTNDDSVHSGHLSLLSHGSVHNNDDQSSKETKSSEDEDFEDDSGGDLSDDLNLPSSDSKPRTAKDVAYVDKRGLISGIRSLKLDKTRALNRQAETMIRSTENINVVTAATSSLNSKDQTSINNNIMDKRCSETNGQYSEKTANNNKYEFLMTL